MPRPSLYGQPMTTAERKAAQVNRRLFALELVRDKLRDALAQLEDNAANSTARMMVEAALKDLDEIR